MAEHSPLTHGGIADAVKDRLGPSWCIAATDIADELYPLHSAEVARLTAENAALRETLEKVHGLLPPAGWPNNSLLCDPIRALIEARIPELKGTHDHQDR